MVIDVPAFQSVVGCKWLLIVRNKSFEILAVAFLLYLFNWRFFGRHTQVSRCVTPTKFSLQSLYIQWQMTSVDGLTSVRDEWIVGEAVVSFLIFGPGQINKRLSTTW